ncbi:hypothetical protein KR018_008932 [Drosophila ironensis]|nr:hypothetical protein KR018_008932 [Drosophila ironensis]
MQCYDEVERKLTLVTNKIVMSHDIERATLLNNEGSVLGPLLYCLFTSDMPQPDGSLPMMLATFADDVCVTYRSACELDAASEMQDYATTFAQWARRWNIGINSSKSANVCFTLRRQTPPAITLEEEPVMVANSAKYLGLTLDRRLTFSKHITALRMRIRAAAAKHFWLLSSRSKLSLSNKRTVYNQVTVFPVSHQHTVLQLRDDVVAECNQGVIAITDCVSTMYGAFFKPATQDTCARGLHAGVTAHCETQASHLSPITLVDDGIRIVNECPAIVSTDDGPNVETNGTHLITFERLAFINGTKYLNRRESIRKTAGVAASPLLNIIGHNYVLSMPMLQRMNSQNLESIQTLQNEIKSAGSTDIWIAGGVGVSFLISTFILLHLVWRRRRDAWEMQQVAETFKTTEDGLTPKGGVVNTSEG